MNMEKKILVYGPKSQPTLSNGLQMAYTTTLKLGD